MKITIRDALITAISYADIFDYPLTEEELQTWLPFIHKFSRYYLASLQGSTLRSWRTSDGIAYYSLRFIKRLVDIRNKRRFLSQDKWVRARRVAGLLSWIPTIKLIGVTGGLTRSYARAQDDIDLFIITAPRTIWVTRAISTIFLDMFRLRRRPQDRSVQNLMCLNMFMSEDGLALPNGERDLFAAHEVLLMTPLWERDEIYTKFLSANRWARIFLPNAWEKKVKSQKSKVKRKTKDMLRLVIVIWLLRFMDPFTRTLQLRYMSKRRSTEVVTDHVIRFHPRDARVWIKKKLGSRVARFNIPLDKIFYAR
ncbi:MAG: hypothetical protein AAB557_04930 [Patescibacteria group bacterium]